MDKTLLDNTISALRALIIAELDGTSLIRFQRAAKLCQQANTVIQMSAKRVADVVGEEKMSDPYTINGTAILGEILGEGGNVGYDAPMMQMAPRRNAQMDTVDLLREMITTFAPAKPQPKLRDGDLGKLIELRDLAQSAGRETPDLDKKIDEMVAAEAEKYLSTSVSDNKEIAA